MSMTRSLGTGVMWLRSPMRVPSFGVLVIRILLFRVLSWGPLFSGWALEYHTLIRLLKGTIIMKYKLIPIFSLVTSSPGGGLGFYRPAMWFMPGLHSGSENRQAGAVNFWGSSPAFCCLLFRMFSRTTRTSTLLMIFLLLRCSPFLPCCFR